MAPVASVAGDVEHGLMHYDKYPGTGAAKSQFGQMVLEPIHLGSVIGIFQIAVEDNEGSRATVKTIVEFVAGQFEEGPI